MSVIPAQAGYERSTNLIKVTPDGEVVWKRFILPRRWRRRRYNVNGGWHPRVVCAVVLVQAITGTDAVAILVQQRSTSGSVTAFNTPIPSYCLMRINACGCVEWERYFSAAAYSNATYGEAETIIATIPAGRDSVGSSDTEHEGWGNLLALNDGTLLLYYREPDVPLNPSGFIPQHVFVTIDADTGETLTLWRRANMTQPNSQPGPWPMLAIPLTDQWLQIDPIISGVAFDSPATNRFNYRERCEMSAEIWQRSEMASQSGAGLPSGNHAVSGTLPRFLCVSDDGSYLCADGWIVTNVPADEIRSRRGLSLRSGVGSGGVIEGSPGTIYDPGSDPAIITQHCPIRYHSVNSATNGYDAVDRAFEVKSATAVGSEYIVSANLHLVNNSGNLATPILRRYDSSLAVLWEVSAPTCHRLLSTSDGVFALARDPVDNNDRHLTRIDPADGSIIWRLRSEVRHTITATEDGMLWLGGAENLTTYSN